VLPCEPDGLARCDAIADYNARKGGRHQCPTAFHADLGDWMAGIAVIAGGAVDVSSKGGGHQRVRVGLRMFSRSLSSGGSRQHSSETDRRRHDQSASWRMSAAIGCQLGEASATVASSLVLIAVLVVRPRGLFGRAYLERA